MQVTDPSAGPRRAVASSETAREINRDIVLHAIHLHQPVSRADLARLTGLQPSTVSVIIGQLIDEGWVLPGSFRPAAAWPPANLCDAQRSARNAGHRSAAGKSQPGGCRHQRQDPGPARQSRSRSKRSPRKRPTPAIAHIARAAHIAEGGLWRPHVPGIGRERFRARGSKNASLCSFRPNAPWGQIDLYAELQRVLDTPIEMENAANACLFSERWFGNFNDASNMLVVSVSEGIGAGLLVDGRVVRGNNDMAGEFGHMPLEESGPVCGCGNVGCWETFRLKPGRAAVLPRACAGERPHLVSGTARSGPRRRHPRPALDRQDDELPGARIDDAGCRSGARSDHHRGRLHGACGRAFARCWRAS